MHYNSFVLAAASAIISLGSSQSVDPNSVSISLRNAWCTSQIASCPLICTQETDGSAATLANDCEPETLAYNCVCENGLTPNITQYSQTVPYYICTEASNQCVTNCGLSNNACASQCRSKQCGASNPTRVNSTASTSGTATTTGIDSSGTAVYTGFGASASSTGSSSSSSSSKNGGSGSSSGAGRVMVDLGRLYGLGVVAAGVFAGFTLLL